MNHADWYKLAPTVYTPEEREVIINYNNKWKDIVEEFPSNLPPIEDIIDNIYRQELQMAAFLSLKTMMSRGIIE